jgi:hypothetical protein
MIALAAVAFGENRGPFAVVQVGSEDETATFGARADDLVELDLMGNVWFAIIGI